MDTLLEGKKLVRQKSKNGTTYVYEVVDHYWDKEKKQSRTRQIYLGKLDPETGNFIPVMDKGFYSGPNIDELCARRHHFTIAVPSHLNYVRERIDEYRDEIDGPNGLRMLDGETIYVKTFLYLWGKTRRRCYLHIFFSPGQMADDRISYDLHILDLERELVEEQLVEAHAEQYKQFFIVKETPKRGRKVLRNADAITAARKRYVGFNAILTSRLKDPLEALQVYREKDVIEKSFDDLKNELDMKCLRVHASQRMKGRTFIQFIAMILSAQIRKSMRETGLSEKYTARRLLWELESLTTISYKGRYKSKLSEITKEQRIIFEAFGVTPEYEPCS
ncbi:MAG: hypothetical protein GX900_03190 [Clostridiaceae bacterium]|nr:hypothetical protein [Clostridiaceae bacterium]